MTRGSSWSVAFRSEYTAIFYGCIYAYSLNIVNGNKRILYLQLSRKQPKCHENNH